MQDWLGHNGNINPNERLAAMLAHWAQASDCPVVTELKILHQGLETTIKQGLVQTADYADRCGAEEAHLMRFNRRPKVSWNKRIWQRDAVLEGRTIGVWGA